MFRRLLAVACMSLGFCGFVSSAHAYVTWDYESKISVTGGGVDNGDGTWTYSFNVVNNDPSAIWFIGLYTGSQQAFGMSETLGLTNAYTQFTDGGVFNIPSTPDQWLAGFYNGGWPNTASFASGASGSLTFNTSGEIGDNLDYAYWTQGNWGGGTAEHFTAVGTTNIAAVPEPETYAMLLAGLGLLGWQARRRKLQLTA